MFRENRNGIGFNIATTAQGQHPRTHLLRPQTARLIYRLLAVLLDSGGLTVGEYNLISRNLRALAKTGELAPAIAPKLLTPQEAAEILAISYSQFRSLEKEGAFPFRRKLVGNKTVRYRNTDIYDYINAPDIQEKQTEGETH